MGKRERTGGEAGGLPGGIGSGGRVIRIGDTVRRPRGDHSASLSALLDYLNSVGFPAPVPLGMDPDGRDVYRWIEGEVAVPPFPAWSLEDRTLASVGTLLRRYHDAVCLFRPPTDARWSDELADPAGGSIICHNDVCPENVVFRDRDAVALLDFDFAAPGRPVWDVAATARLWIPLWPPNATDPPSRSDRFRRLRVLAEAYGLSPDDREPLVDAIIENNRIGSAFVRNRARAREPAFVAMWGAARRRGGGRMHRRMLRGTP